MTTSRGTWSIEKKTGGVWVSDGTVYRPNDDFTTRTSSTQSTATLVDGDNAYITPSTKYLEGALTFVWYEDDGTTKTKIEAYITGQNDLRITDDLSNVFTGRFLSIETTRIVGRATLRYNIRATWENMSSLT